jgi:hypothetical protein
MLLYEKHRGLVMLNQMGTLMWSLCNGENSIREIAKKVIEISSGGYYEKVLIDTRGFFVSLFQRGFVTFREAK